MSNWNFILFSLLLHIRCTRAKVSCGNTSLSPCTVFVMKFSYNNSTQDPYKGKSWAAVSTTSKFLITMNSFEIAKHYSKQNKLCVQMFPLSLMKALRQDSPRNNSWHGFDWNIVGIQLKDLGTRKSDDAMKASLLSNRAVKFPELTGTFF